jgi:hypothetical protein
MTFGSRRVVRPRPSQRETLPPRPDSTPTALARGGLQTRPKAGSGHRSQVALSTSAETDGGLRAGKNPRVCRRLHSRRRRRHCTRRGYLPPARNRHSDRCGTRHTRLVRRYRPHRSHRGRSQDRSNTLCTSRRSTRCLRYTASGQASRYTCRAGRPGRPGPGIPPYRSTHCHQTGTPDHSTGHQWGRDRHGRPVGRVRSHRCDTRGNRPWHSTRLHRADTRRHSRCHRDRRRHSQCAARRCDCPSTAHRRHSQYRRSTPRTPRHSRDRQDRRRHRQPASRCQRHRSGKARGSRRSRSTLDMPHPGSRSCRRHSRSQRAPRHTRHSRCRLCTSRRSCRPWRDRARTPRSPGRTSGKPGTATGMCTSRSRPSCRSCS